MRICKLMSVRAAAVVICVVSFCTLSGRALASETAGEFASLCSNVSVAAKTPDGQVHFDSNFDSGRCWGAFAAVQELSRIRADMTKPPLLGICAPENATRLELIKAFVGYVSVHPEVRRQEFSAVVLISLRSRFPCSELR